jgi:hypothetical protein
MKERCKGNWTLRIFVTLLCSLAMALSAENPFKRLNYIKEGVYYAPTAVYIEILELTNGGFRHWIWSTNKLGGASTVMESGSYQTNGGTVKFVLKDAPANIRTNEYVLFDNNGIFLLRTPEAVSHWEKYQRRLAWGTLRWTTKTPEQILGSR